MHMGSPSPFSSAKLRAKLSPILLLQVCTTQSLYWSPRTSCFSLLLQNQVCGGCWKSLTPIDPAIKLHFCTVGCFCCARHHESGGQGPIKTGYQKQEESEFVPPSPLGAVTTLASYCLLFKSNLDPAAPKKKKKKEEELYCLLYSLLMKKKALRSIYRVTNLPSITKTILHNIGPTIQGRVCRTGQNYSQLSAPWWESSIFKCPLEQ